MKNECQDILNDSMADVNIKRLQFPHQNNNNKEKKKEVNSL